MYIQMLSDRIQLFRRHVNVTVASDKFISFESTLDRKYIALPASLPSGLKKVKGENFVQRSFLAKACSETAAFARSEIMMHDKTLLV